jgi:molecular chaperone Hsp33
VRGFISPAQLGSFDNAHNALYGEIGELNLVVSQDGKIENSGTTPISLHDVVNDLAYHYCISDQIETGISVMIGFNADPENPVRLCQGLFLQALPNTDLERFDRIRRHLDNPDVRTALGTPADLKTLCQILLSEEPDFKGIQKETCPTPHFKCTCSLEKMATVVRSLPIPERMELVKKGEAVGIKCQFCNTHYELSINDCIKAWNTPSSVEN